MAVNRPVWSVSFEFENAVGGADIVKLRVGVDIWHERNRLYGPILFLNGDCTVPDDVQINRFNVYVI